MPPASPESSSPSPSSPTSAAPRQGRQVGQILLDVLSELGRHPSIWDPWLFMTPRTTGSPRRSDTSPRR